MDRVRLTLEQGQQAGGGSKAYANAEGWQNGHIKGVRQRQGWSGLPQV